MCFIKKLIKNILFVFKKTFQNHMGDRTTISIEEEIMQDIQVILDKVDDVLTEYGLLKDRIEREKATIDLWDNHAKEIMNEIVNTKDDVAKKQLEELAKSALKLKILAEKKVEPLERALAELEPFKKKCDGILHLIELTENTIYSQRSRLVANLSYAEMQEKFVDFNYNSVKALDELSNQKHSQIAVAKTEVVKEEIDRQFQGLMENIERDIT